MTTTSMRTAFLAIVALGPLLAGGTTAMGKDHPDKSLERALEVQERHQETLNRIPGVSGTAVGPATNGSGLVIKVYITPGASAADKRKIPKKLDGEAVEIVEAPPERPQ